MALKSTDWRRKRSAATVAADKARGPQAVRYARVDDQFPTFELDLHRWRKGKGRIGRKGWTLRKANVSRDKRTGRFTGR